MKFRIITLFPEMFIGPLTTSILKRASENGIFSVEFIDLREFGLGKRRKVDDSPYGGGAGMVLRVDVMEKAIEKARHGWPKAKILLLTPQGKVFNQEIAKTLLITDDQLIIVCGHYEGFDERIRKMVDMELSIGEYILTGGEIAAMVVLDTIVRLIPGSLGSEESINEETFSQEKIIEYPHYTRPENWHNEKVPKILLSGNHDEIKKWREKESRNRSEKYQK